MYHKYNDDFTSYECVPCYNSVDEYIASAKEALLKCRGGQFGQLREPASFLTPEGFALPGYAFSPVQLPEGWTGTLCLAERRA